MAGSDCLPVPGVRLGVAAAGIRAAGREDLVLVELAEGSAVAACFTRNAFCAAPVRVAREHLRRAPPRYLLINSGNANAGLGERGMADARRCCELLARRCGVAPESVLPFSTGVIGEPLPVERIAAALPAARSSLAAARWPDAARGMMTTDTRPKVCSRRFAAAGARYTVTGMAKGAGMLRPDMATMLAFLATDAAVPGEPLRRIWRDAVERSFNRVTVDGDTSSNDAALLIATGQSPAPPIEGERSAACRALAGAVRSVALQLAQELARDAEGGTKFVAVRVAGGRDSRECLAVAYTIAHSPLVKTALFAGDPNWGRLLAAVGRAPLRALDMERVSLRINDVLVAERGERAPDYSEAEGAAAMRAAELAIEVDLGRGAAAETVWTADLSCDYVRINAEYRT